MYYGEIKTTDIANGTGVRVSLFVSGCRHHCKGCFNPETWDFCYGKPFDREAEEKILLSLRPDYIEGLSLLGGDPMEAENVAALLPFIKRVKELYPNKNVWCYTGDVFENLMRREDARQLLAYIDILVDGPFVEQQKNIMLRFRGSENQRILNVPKSLLENKAIGEKNYENCG